MSESLAALLIAVMVAIFFFGFLAGRRHGRTKQEVMTNLYRDMWMEGVNPNDPKYAPIKDYYGKRRED